MCGQRGGDVAAYIGSVMNNSMSNTVKIDFSKHNESYQNWLDLHLLVSVHSTVQQYILLSTANSTTHTHTPIRTQYMQPHHRINQTLMYFNGLS